MGMGIKWHFASFCQPVLQSSAVQMLATPVEKICPPQSNPLYSSIAATVKGWWNNIWTISGFHEFGFDKSLHIPWKMLQSRIQLLKISTQRLSWTNAAFIPTRCWTRPGMLRLNIAELQKWFVDLVVTEIEGKTQNPHAPEVPSAEAFFSAHAWSRSNNSYYTLVWEFGFLL